MATIWPLPHIEIQSLSSVQETRPAAVLTGEHSWEAVGSALNLPIVVQAEPKQVTHDFLQSMADGLPQEVEVVYGVGGGLVADVAKYIGWAKHLPTVVVPTALSVDGLFTALVAERKSGSVDYVTTGPADQMIIDWDVISAAPRNVRGSAIIELLTIVTGLLDWRYAAERNQTTPETRYQPWAAGLMAGIAQQAFKIANGVGDGKVDSLRNLLDLICLEVQLTNQLGHNRPQEGSEQYFAYAVEQRAAKGHPIPYADLVGPGLLVAAALHGQDIGPIRSTLGAAGIRLGQLKPDDIIATIKELPEYVVEHDLPYSILNDLDPTSDRVIELLGTTGLDATGTRPL
jgi:glycerol-1-phosphate dehydrogenase [NAD(P)+]